MAQQNPWEMDWSAPAATPSADPIIKPRDPYKAEDQQMQREAARRAAEAADRAANADERAAGAAERTATKDEAGTVDEKKIATLLTRISGGFNDINNVIATDKGAQEPGIIESIRGDLTPGGFTGMPVRAMAGADRRTVHDSQRDVLDALLTLGTGAAYNPEQLSGQMTAYFPQYGDTPKEIAVKNQRMARIIEAAKANAGPAWAQVAPAIAPYMKNIGEPEAGNGTMSEDDARKKSIALWGQEVYDQNGKPLIDPNGGTGYDKSGKELGIVGGTTDETVNPEVQKLADAEGDQSGYRGLKNLGAQGISLGLSDEAAGVGGFLSAYLTGKNPVEQYDINKAAQNLVLDRARQAHPIGGTIAELAGGGGAVRMAGNALTVGQAFKSGAGVGALSGFGYGDGAQESVQNALVGGVIGGVIGGGAQKINNALTSRAASAAPDMELVAAGQRQNIPIRQPDARPELRGNMAHVETSPRGGPMIREARAADEAAIEQRVTDIGGPGNASDPYALGSKVQEAGNRYIARTRQQADRLYGVASKEAGGATVTAKNAGASLDANIQELKAAGENSNAAAIKYLTGLREDINGGMTLESVQNLRTNMRGQLSQNGLTGTDTERRVKQVIDAMNQDLTEQLPQSASTALRAADGFYRERQEFVNGTLKQFLGNKGAPLAAETAASRLTSMTQGKGNYDRFSRMWKELAPEEQADVAATVASSLGRKANGEFSATTLLRSLDPSKGINPRTARLIFGEDGASALIDLRTIARAKADTSQALNNSRTGVIVNESANGLKTLMMGALGFGAGGPGGAALGAVSRDFISKWGEQRAARMLLNPSFTKWLKNAPNTSNPKVIDRYFAKLAGMSSVAANDNAAFVAAIRDGFSKDVSRVTAVASPDQQKEGNANR